MIPLVVASEKGRAQTGVVKWPASLHDVGVVRSDGQSCRSVNELQILFLVERSWNGRPKRVTAP
jgi:hypothetical protein